jgi:hypothetical protein
MQKKKSDKLRKNYCRNKKKVGVTRDNELNEIVQYGESRRLEIAEWLYRGGAASRRMPSLR